MENYHNYQRGVLPDTEESLSKIAAKISDHAVVLDIGCSSGMLGEFLVKAKGCIMDGVDVDQAALEQCSRYYRKTLRRDLDRESLLPEFAEQSYDFIVVADVVEHLYDAAFLLSQLKRLVKPNGTILFSVPNVSHLALALELLYGKFTYRDYGLLDNTHLRFFTHEGLLKKLEASGIYPWELDSVTRPVEATEFDGPRERQFPKVWLDAITAYRPDALVYQWIVSAKIYPSLAAVATAPRPPAQVPLMTMALYWATKENTQYSEQNKYIPLCRRDRNGDLVATVEFRDLGPDSYARLRFDPLSEAKAVWIKSASIRDALGAPVWEWGGRAKNIELIGASWVDSPAPTGKLLLARNDDPQWHLNLQPSHLAALGAGAVFQAVIDDRPHAVENFLCAAIDTLLASDRHLHQKLAARKEREERLEQEFGASLAKGKLLEGALAEVRRTSEAALNDAQMELSQARSLHGRVHDEVLRRDEMLRTQYSRMEDLTQRLAASGQEMERMRQTLSWRVTVPLRWARTRLPQAGNAVRAAAMRGAKMLYRALPLPQGLRNRAKGWIFFLLSPFIRSTAMYRRWQRFQQANSPSADGSGFRPAAFGPAGPSSASGSALGGDARYGMGGTGGIGGFAGFAGLAGLGGLGGLGGIGGAGAAARRSGPVALPGKAQQAQREYVEFSAAPGRFAPPVRLVAFYLPQFHPIPENDEWWGRGFTEWTNVTRAVPQFEGHYQPHLPADLGFYDLRIPDIQKRQVELAKAYGIGAFCFYFYWFGGKTLLEHPTRQYLEHPEFDLPFCLCWANENWSRRWDGQDDNVLIAQAHSPEDDLAFIAYIAPYLRDPRYLRIGGKPVLLVYRPNLLPSSRKTAERWRNWCRKNGIGEIYLVCTQSFEMVDPATHGFDAATEFPPNNSAPPDITDDQQLLNPGFAGTVYDWQVFLKRSRVYAKPDYKLFRGVCPSWDNEARKPGRGTAFRHSWPAAYQEWVRNAAVETVGRFAAKDERLVFVNAWNEWAEGAHLEPDQRYGFAWLQATRDGLAEAALIGCERRMVLVAPDAGPRLAATLCLHLARTLAHGFGFRVETVLLAGGPLEAEFALCGSVHLLGGADGVATAGGQDGGAQALELARTLATAGFRNAIGSGSGCGRFLGLLADAGLRCVALAHEPGAELEAPGLAAHVAALAGHAATVVVVPSKLAAQRFAAQAAVPEERLRIAPPGLPKQNALRWKKDEAAAGLRRQLGVAEGAPVVLGAGWGEHRSGLDLFVDVGCELASSHPGAVFVWFGGRDAAMQALVDHRLADHAAAGQFRFIDSGDADLFHAGADVFALTARDTTFPLEAVQALAVGVPVVGFQGDGGLGMLLDGGCGALVAKDSIPEFAAAVRAVLDDPVQAQRMGECGIAVAQSLPFRDYVFDLIAWAGAALKRVSVLVPLGDGRDAAVRRLEGVLDQSYPVFEIIVLDDADDGGRDGCLEAVQACLVKTAIRSRVLKVGPGTAAAQRLRGVEEAAGNWVWICASGFAEGRNPGLLESAILDLGLDGAVGDGGPAANGVECGDLGRLRGWLEQQVAREVG